MAASSALNSLSSISMLLLCRPSSMSIVLLTCVHAVRSAARELEGGIDAVSAISLSSS